MKKIKQMLAAMLVAVTLSLLGAEVYAREVIPGGMTFGVQLACEGVIIVGIGDVSVGKALKSPGRDAGLRVSDVIREIDGKAVSSASEVAGAIAASEGEALTLVCERSGERFEATLTPARSDSDGKMRAGLLIRDGAAGIGTVTYIDPATGAFAGLGHGICDADSGELIPIKRGLVVGVELVGVVRGEPGAPGELRGSFTGTKLGSLLENTERGVYGVLASPPDSAETIETASLSELREGEAEIICTAKPGEPERYKVAISEIDRSGESLRAFVVTVTDPRLLELTGGIVQGMSGSPIIQDGRLIGAVTHVLVGDPTRGYGIPVEVMLG